MHSDHACVWGRGFWMSPMEGGGFSQSCEEMLLFITCSLSRITNLIFKHKLCLHSINVKLHMASVVALIQLHVPVSLLLYLMFAEG